MKRTSLIVMVAFSLLCPLLLQAQTEGSAFTITGHGVATAFSRDYQCLGINPANLDIASPYKGKFVTISTIEIGASLYSEILTKPELRQNLLGGKAKKLSLAEQKEYALEFAHSTNSGDLDIMSTGIAVQTNHLGSFAFSTRDRVSFFSKLGPQVSELLWLGRIAPYFEQLVLANGDTIPNMPNLSSDTLNQVVQGVTSLSHAATVSEMLEGTHFQFHWVREFSLGYGKKLLGTENIELYGGIGIKFLLGQGMLNLEAKDGIATGFGAMSPVFNIDYGETTQENPSSLGENAKPLKPVGWGLGIDLGTTLRIKNKWIVSAAVTDIGSMTWNGNVYQMKDFKLTDFSESGLESTSFIEQIDRLNGGDGLIEWQGSTKLKTKLPTSARAGVGLIINDKLRGGVDWVAPINDDLGSIEKPVISAGGEFSPMPWIHLSLGVIHGGNYDTKIPAGIRFTLGNGTYEMGIASRDMVTFFTDHQPTLSFCIGFLRFRF